MRARSVCAAIALANDAGLATNSWECLVLQVGGDAILAVRLRESTHTRMAVGSFGSLPSDSVVN